jgi:2-(1,2-epoxy-1,2-dihydrophenyl)acetyl-CoA isomerase
VKRWSSEIENNTLVITFRHEASRNALDAASWGELADLLADTGDARAVLFRGEGGTFCSGADLRSVIDSEGNLDDSVLTESVFADVERFARALITSPIPTIAAVNGPAVGAGFSIAAACDIVYATPTSYFSALFVERGLVADVGLTWVLPRIVGLRTATELLISGRRVSAEEAVELGLITEVVEGRAIDRRCEVIAREICELPPQAVRANRLLVRANAEASLDDALANERVAQQAAVTGSESRAAITAFLDKAGAQLL